MLSIREIREIYIGEAKGVADKVVTSAFDFLVPEQSSEDMESGETPTQSGFVLNAKYKPSFQEEVASQPEPFPTHYREFTEKCNKAFGDDIEIIKKVLP